jgi:hypothetical protein
MVIPGTDAACSLNFSRRPDIIYPMRVLYVTGIEETFMTVEKWYAHFGMMGIEPVE